MKILLVDDNKFIRDSFSERLKKNKYEVVSAEDGEEAIEKIAADDFDVVITDIVNSQWKCHPKGSKLVSENVTFKVKN